VAVIRLCKCKWQVVKQADKHHLAIALYMFLRTRTFTACSSSCIGPVGMLPTSCHAAAVRWRAGAVSSVSTAWQQLRHDCCSWHDGCSWHYDCCTAGMQLLSGLLSGAWLQLWDTVYLVSFRCCQMPCSCCQLSFGWMSAVARYCLRAAMQLLRHLPCNCCLEVGRNTACQARQAA
jgi:hypothetical protein